MKQAVVWRNGIIVLILNAFLFAFPTNLEARGTPNGFADLVEKLAPAVVNIATTMVVERQTPPSPFPPGSPFERFFDRFEGMPNGSQERQSLGSGFIIDGEKGLIVTNNHVVADASEIQVILADDQSFPAEILGTDSRTDLALLKIEVPKSLPQVEFGNSDAARIGDWVVAIGNPHGLGGTVTAGIVSARGRDLGAGPYDDFIQTDAPINPGNSGGPLFNMQGEVIGINTAIFSSNGGSIGIGFSIPSNQAIAVLEQLEEFGSTRRGWLGVSITSISDEIVETLGLPEGTTGTLVNDVMPNSPASEAGLIAGDLILEVDGIKIEGSRELSRMIADTEVGKTVTLSLIRKGKQIEVKVTLGRLEHADLAENNREKPNRDHANQFAEFERALGMKVRDIGERERQQFDLPQTATGVVIIEVEPESDAAQKGIITGDTIRSINQIQVDSYAEVERHVEAAFAANRNSVLLQIVGKAGGRFIVLSLQPAE